MSSFAVTKLAYWTISRRSNVGFAFHDFENAATKKVAVLIFGIFCTWVFAKGPFRRSLSLRAYGPRVLRWKTLRVSSAPHPCGFESLCTGPKKERPSSLGAFSIKWWAMRGVRVRLAPPAPRFVASLLACCAGKRLRVSSAPHPCGFESLCDGPEKGKASIAGGLFNQVVGDEGCRVRLRRPLSLRRFAPRVLRWKTLRVSSAPHPGGFESLCTGPKKERPPSLGAFSIKWWAMRDSNPQPCACKAPALTVAPIARAERV